MSLLFQFRPLVINPELAARIGLNEAIVLQQINYWLNETDSGIEHNGRKWVYNTMAQWSEQFPFWSQDTVKRTISSLRKMNILLTEKLAKDRYNHTNYYTINYDADALSDKCNLHHKGSADCPEHDDGNLHHTDGAESTDLTYNTQCTTPDTTAETNSDAGENLPSVLPKQKRKKQDDNAILGDLPDWIPAEPWIAFVEMRKEMGARGRLSERAVKLLVADLKKLKEQGQDLTEVINRSVMNNWKGFFAVKQQYPGRQQALEDRNRAAADSFARGDW